MKSLESLKIYFMGTPLFAEKILQHLLEKGVPIALVITQPDRPMGRKQELVPSAVKSLATANSIPIKQFEKIDQEALDFFVENIPDLIIVAAYGLILPQALIELPLYGCINVHGSLLPLLRGPSPIQTALLHGHKQTGTSIMLMDEKMDHGQILSQKKIVIEKEDTYNTLENKIYSATADIFVDTLKKWVAGQIKPTPQDHRISTYTKIISKLDGKIQWSSTAKDIYHQYQAFHRWPKVYCSWNQTPAAPKTKAETTGDIISPVFHKTDLKKIIFLKLDYTDKNDSAARGIGQVFMTESGQVAVQTSQGLILPQLVQLQGKNPASIKDFINGYPNFISAILE